jgi:hypothetical protein
VELEERVAVLESQMKGQGEVGSDFRKEMRERLNRLELGVMSVLVGTLAMLAKAGLDAMGK